MKKVKKIKEIKAEKYEENEDLYVELEEDDYEEENENIIIEEDYFEENETTKRINSNKFMKVFNIIFILIMLAMVFISVDVICITKYNVGPFFAIKTKTYNDGGTKEYYGLGYKVIKYKEKSGRQDKQIGFWSMKYNTTPTFIKDIDLSIEFQNNPQKTADKFYKQYVKISSTIKEIKQSSNNLILEYTDPDGKYTLQINCDCKEKISTLTQNQNIIIRGTIHDFSVKDENNPNTIYVSDCFVE